MSGISKIGEETAIKATITKVLYDRGNRVYQLSFSDDNVGKAAYVRLDLTDTDEERDLFFNINSDNTVMVNIHKCPDLTEQQGNEASVYYVWQRRSLNRLPSVCPRCKYRLDAPVLRKRGT